MIETLGRHREHITAAIEKTMMSSASHLDRVGRWAEDFRKRVTDFACRGKLIRGSLVAVGSEVFGGTPDDDVYSLAAAVELIQSFLLIHDDIMDEDSVRRGQPTVFAQYRSVGEEHGYSEPQRFGESMGICAGDVAMLLAIECAAGTSYDAEMRVRLIQLLASEIADVGIAQMGDVANGHSIADVPEADILSVYQYKTGRYTFSLPLTLGAVTAGASENEVEALALWGELEGLIFQVRDDELGLLEDDAGKPAGTDVESDKKTLHRQRLFERAAGSRWAHVVDYYGKPLTGTKLEEVRTAVDELGVLDSVRSDLEKMHLRAAETLELIQSMAPESRAQLDAIANYNLTRSR